MPSEADALIETVRAELAAAADPARAPGMQAYMKSEMPYRGVAAPVQRRIYRAVFNAHRLQTFEAWRDCVLRLFREASHREERYAAIELTGHRYYRQHQTMRALPMYEEMITTGAWWDLVDGLASGRLVTLLESEPEAMARTMRSWSRSDDMWKRRSSIICQIKRKGATDLDLLFHCIEPSLDSREFFLRKAIGWALRALAHTDPETVRRYVREHEDRLSGLSRREALKHIGA